MSPYIYMLILLPAVRYGFPALVPNGFAIMCTFGYIFWVDLVILVCGMLGAATLRVSVKTYHEVCRRTVGHVAPVLVTMGSLLVVSYIMQSPSTGMMNLLASDIAAIVGKFYPAAAVLIGSSGAFITGTGLGSNIMFADMHLQAAEALSMNPITIFAGQNAGASLGNLICPNNTVAACATVDAIGRLRNGRPDRQRKQRHEKDAQGICRHSGDVYGTCHALYLRAVPDVRHVGARFPILNCLRKDAFL